MTERFMSQPKVKTSRMAETASILMIVLGVFTLFVVSFIIGVAITVLGAGMYLFHLSTRRKFQRPTETEASPSSGQ